ncbi:hypothetical protein F511_39110 [Dorcoceras hygrometricum]|uniref:Uncharacterized protein n=1 Tax=Dorcoceras hygrometricum TaxID=472368 RepID=A0A2Z7CFT3_9LAMI|nr:hypothetical protein F511_39110 [Dorcoceras hygrometricum]
MKDMVTPYSKQAKGFAAQICVLLQGSPDLTLGECKTFPPLKFLTVKTVCTYVAKNNHEEEKDNCWEICSDRKDFGDCTESVEIETAEKYVEEETAKVEEENKDEETEKEATNKGKRDVEAIDSENTEPLSKQIPEDMMLPSVTAEKPSKIEFGHGIEIKEVDWHKATLPTIDPMDKGKAPLVG